MNLGDLRNQAAWKRHAEATADAAQAPAAPRWRPFPSDALPRSIREHAIETATGMDADPLLVIAPAISIFAAAVGNAVRVVVRTGWTEPCAIWTGVIAQPGSLKTQTQSAAAQPAHEAQRLADADFDRELRDHEAALNQWESARKRSKDADPQPKPEEPIRQQWLVGDTTPEALAQVLGNNPRGVVALHDELGAFFGGFGRYSRNAGGSEPGAAFYKSAFNGSPHVENRKGENGRGRYFRIESPLVSVTGSIQPGSFQRLVTRQYVEDGLASRFLWAWPPDRPGGWVEEEPAGQSRAAETYATAYRRLRTIPLDIDPDGKLNPHHVGLSRSAQTLAASWVNGLKDRVGSAPDNAVRAALAKLKGIAFRLALLFHLTDWADRGSVGPFGAIDEHTLQRALAVADWFAAEAERVYAMLAETEHESEARELLAWVSGQAGGVTARQTARRFTRFRSNSAAAELALDAMVSAGQLRSEHPRPGPQGGKPTKKYFPLLADNTPPSAAKNEGIGYVTHAHTGWADGTPIPQAPPADFNPDSGAPFDTDLPSPAMNGTTSRHRDEWNFTNGGNP